MVTFVQHKQVTIIQVNFFISVNLIHINEISVDVMNNFT